MAFSWRSRKQFFYFAAGLAIVVISISLAVWFSRPAPSCFDNKQNQDEEGVDCGGSCEIVCAQSAKPLVVLWTRAFKTSEGIYDLTALISNPNTLLGSSLLSYRFKLYDTNNILIGLKQGETFVNPRQDFVVFEPNVNTGKRIPKRAVIEFDELVWRRLEKETPLLKAVQRDFVNFPFPRLSSQVQNSSIFDIRDVYLTAVLFDEKDNALASSQTKIDLIKAEASHPAVFTWSRPLETPPSSNQIFIRTRLVP